MTSCVTGSVTLADGRTLECGSVVVCSGFTLFDARLKEEYGYGVYDNVFTSADIERMLENLRSGGGLAFSQRVLLALVEAGWERDRAYAAVQRAAAAAWDEGASFMGGLEADRAIVDALGESGLARCFDEASTLRTGAVFERLSTIRTGPRASTTR